MSVGLYLKDISKIPLIDINKEIELSQRIQKGDKKAIDELVRANLRFGVSIAKQYQNKGLPLVDLIQSAAFGLVEAAKRYDATKNIKFISYAVWWIRQSIMLALSNECRTVRVPTNQIAHVSKINKVIARYEQEKNRPPSSEELEQETGLTSLQVDLALSSINRSLSLDTPFKDEDSNTLEDVLPDSLRSDENTVSESVRSEIMAILNELPYRDSDIVKMYFGIGMDPMTYEEISERFGIGEERVRQINLATLKILKKKYGDRLKDLL